MTSAVSRVSPRARCIAVAALSAVLAPVSAQVVERDVRADPIRIESGLVAGKRNPSGIRAYFGVPFAAAPVRNLRWREPQPVTSWTGVYHADRFAPECIQVLRAHDINHYFGEEATSEDCLYLNIWAPVETAAHTARPVVVWIYGGGFTIGSAAMANYSGESLAHKGVVYVSIAYRLGALGFLAHPALTAESRHHASGNLGFLDQLAALNWIRRNIARFGGDPGNVTIMGQSAGSMSVSLLQASPLARGLFERGVGMSGGAIGRGVVAQTQTLERAEAAGLQLQQYLKAGGLAAMRNVPADRILQAQLSMATRYGAVADGYFLPASPDELFAAGKQNDVPLVIGFTRDESFSDLARAKSLSDYRERATQLFGDRVGEFLRLYPATDDDEVRHAAVEAGRDSSVSLQMRSWARAQAATGHAPVYVYLFSRVHPYAPGVSFADHDPKTMGAYHTGDVPFWLGTLDSLNLFRTTRNWTEDDRRLSDTMMNAIVAFAAHGNPNPTGTHTWPAYRPDREEVREFGDVTRVVGWPNAARLDFFAATGGEAGRPPAPATERGRD